MSAASSNPAGRENQPIGLGIGLRVSAAYAVIFAGGALGLYWVAYAWIAMSLQASELESLRGRVREYRAWFEDGGLAALESRFTDQRRAGDEILFLRVVGRDGEALFFSQPRSGVPVDAAALQAIAPGEDRSDIGASAGEERWTVATERTAGGVIIQAGKSSRVIDRVLGRFRRAFLLATLPALALGLVTGLVLTYHQMRPLRRLLSTVKEILRTGELDRRAEAPASGGNELGELSELFNRLLDRNQRLIDAMHHSLDAVAHDLRTPMTRLRNVAESALAGERRSGVAEEALQTCLEESEEALTLLSALTEIAEAEAGALQLRLEAVSVPDALVKAGELYEFVAEERGIRLSVEAEDGLAVRADPARLQQILANLVDNAIKHGPAGGTVRLSAAGAGEVVRLSVSDEGPGIAPADQARIWERLFRGDASRSQRGLGLGLSLVRAVAEAHGGRAGIGGGHGAGTTFYIELPAATRPSGP